MCDSWSDSSFSFVASAFRICQTNHCWKINICQEYSQKGFLGTVVVWVKITAFCEVMISVMVERNQSMLVWDRKWLECESVIGDPSIHPVLLPYVLIVISDTATGDDETLTMFLRLQSSILTWKTLSGVEFNVIWSNSLTHLIFNIIFFVCFLLFLITKLFRFQKSTFDRSVEKILFDCKTKTQR